MWYANDINTLALSNIVGAFQLNDTANFKQDGFSLTVNSTLLIVMLKNPRNATGTHASLQLSLIDAWIPTDDSSTEEAPVFVIIIAVLVGGLISCTCLGIFIYMSVKAYKNRKLKEAEDAESQRLTASERKLGKREKNEQLGYREEKEIVQLDDNFENRIQNKDTIKVQPDNSKNKKNTKGGTK